MAKGAETDTRLGYRGTQVLTFIRRTLRRTGDVPTYGEIRDALGFADRADVCRVVQRLEKRGLVRRSGYGRQKRIRLNVEHQPSSAAE